MNEKTFFNGSVIFCIVLFLAGIGLGVFSGHGYKTRADELADTVERLEAALADATSRADTLAGQLASSRAELATIRARIGIAQGIADEIDTGIGGAIDAVDRIIRKMELLESALSVVLDW